jgi:recombination protein RecT
MAESADTTPLRAELERATAPEAVQTIYQLIDRQKPELEKVVGKTIGVERFTRTVMTEIRRTPKLLECSADSLLGAMMLAAQLGLEPGPLGHVYLVPFKGQVEFIVGYRGYVELAYRSGQVKDIAASIVAADEPFEYRKGTRPFLDHSPQPRERASEVVAAYAVARLRTGGTVFEVIYPDEWELAQQRSAAGAKNLGPWAEHTDAMIRKTAVRRLEPMLPKSPELAVALERDEAPAPAVEELADDAA